MMSDGPNDHQSVRILSNLESIYMANLVKRKLEGRVSLNEDFEEMSTMALKTLSFLMSLLLLKPQWN